MKTEQLQVIIKQAIKDTFGLEIDPNVEYAPAGKGDFATNAAFQAAEGKNPAEAAQKLADAIKDDSIDKSEAAGPYVNIWLKDNVWRDELDQFDSKYGRKEGSGRKVQVEFISANPTGPLTIGNARGGFVGDVLSNVLESQGNDVTREYYFNDAGTQIMKLVESIKAAAGLVQPEEIQYRGQYIDEIAAELKDELGKADQEIALLATKLIFDKYIKGAIEKMGINFDEWFNERTLKETGQFDEALAKLKGQGLTIEKEGAIWLQSGKLGDDRDERVLVKSNETKDVTYLGNDIPYHLNIFEKRGFEQAIKVWGADHVGQVNSLKLVVNKLVPGKDLDFIIVQWVRLVRDGQEVKSGKRTGTFVTVEDVLEEIPADVARFIFLMRSADSHMDFDLDLAKEQTQKNPYWYVMYSYVRCQSIVAKAADKGLTPAGNASDLSSKERELVRQISRWPELLQEVSWSHEVHKLTFFGQEIAKLFHDYYEGEKIIDLPQEEAVQKLYFVQQVSLFLENYFAILGIEPIKKM